CGLGSLFFSALTALGAQRIGVDTKGLRDACAEAIGLHERGDEGLDIVDAGAVIEITKGVGAGLACPKLQVHQIKLVRQIGMSVTEILAHAHHRLIEGKASFDADDGEVERVRHAEADAGLAVIDFAFEEKARDEKSESGYAQQERR